MSINTAPRLLSSASVAENAQVSFTEGPARMGLDLGNLAGPQRVHAFAILVLPVFGVAFALFRAFEQGIGWVEAGALGVMYSVSWIGITVGYHRFYTHRSFKAVAPVRFMLAFFGSIACQGPLNYWVSNHRRHHQFSDLSGDIHSPKIVGNSRLGRLAGFWHSHIGWTFTHELTNTAVVARDLLKDPLARFMNRTYYVWLTAGFLLPALVCGVLTGTLEGALSGFLWGGVVRLFLCYHSTNTITSLTHMIGTQPFASRDASRNNVWLALPTWGEGWHNNHHAFPSSAIFGLRWWQIDFGAWFIRALQALRLVWDVRRPNSAALAAKARPLRDGRYPVAAE